MEWTVETLNALVDAEVAALPKDMLAQLARLSLLIKQFGVGELREPHAKHMEGPLWELRLKGKDGISRAFYVTAAGRRVVIVRVFIKKTQKTPRREIKLALERAKEIR